MRARHLVFHVNCFSCALCNTILNKGDQFGMRDSTVYCRLHYEISAESHGPSSCQFTSHYGSSPTGPSSPSGGGIGGGVGVVGGGGGGCVGGGGGGSMGSIDVQSTPNSCTKLGLSGGGFFGSATHNLTGLPQAPRQKGRPRKRKPKDIEAMTANLGKSQIYFLNLIFLLIS